MTGKSLDKGNNKFVHYFGEESYWKKTNWKTKTMKKYYTG
jgi:hypothetical protein